MEEYQEYITFYHSQKFMNEKGVFYLAISHSHEVITLLQNNDQTLNSPAIKYSIYRQKRKKTFSQDQIELTVQNIQWDFDWLFLQL